MEALHLLFNAITVIFIAAVAAVRNAGPALAATGIAFADQPAVLGALAGALLSGLAAALPIAALLSSRRSSQGNP
ncbi:hypothetical protein [Streptomyces celluloflavus]|uniref:hypothetical protein n=1 Tax=Streptomyces celluloflavus TaxID=58344 RepID=UPI003698763A